ncbi:transmembrane cytochrome oxidase [Acidovorax sp. HMWF029]|uniref:SURF1 family protein n=1 Tax=Acidovorax sp. HMWF029 TaxID=2056863 RepID=UPI000D34341F|nr:SURF1 family protein [Acidovorax sp. HMWF029]PTT19993.1 transmembrane cytochrome oxidase [Acidovorax sp. HMWF029]
MSTFRRPLGLRFWLITLAAVVGMLVTASLGRWQLSRAAQKETLQAMLDARGRMPAMDGRVLLSQPAEALVHRAVVLEGRWLPEHTVYLDNRQMNGRPGFFVLTPLQLVDSPSGVVLVQRGWVPRNFQDRTQLPQVQTPQDVAVRVAGRVAAAPSRLYEFGGDGSGAGAPGAQGSSRIRQNLDLAAFRTETGLALAPLTVVQTGEAVGAGDGLQRDWPVVGAGVDKHYGYAFQWFGLCGLMALLYVWFQIVRRFIRPRSQPAS